MHNTKKMISVQKIFAVAALATLFIGALVLTLTSPQKASAVASCVSAPFTQTINAGEEVTYAVNLFPDDATSAFELSSGNLPNGTSIAIAQTLGSSIPTSVPFTFSSANNAQRGSFNIVLFFTEITPLGVRGTNLCIFNVVIRPMVAQPVHACAITPPSIDIISGESAGLLVNLTPTQQGLPYQLAVSGLPTGLTANFSSSTGFAPAGPTLSLTSTSDALLGTSTVTVAYAETRTNGTIATSTCGFDVVMHPGIPVVQQVAIDIKPGGNSDNEFSANSGGNIPIALISSETFDALSVDRATIRFEGASLLGHWLETDRGLNDVNNDKKMDLVLQFLIEEATLPTGTSEACLTGRTTSGVEIRGCDIITMNP
jgi:hypothetical protein